MLYCHTSPVRLHHILPHYLINSMICGKITENEMCVLILPKVLSETFLNLRRIRRNIINPHPSSSCQLSAFLVKFERDLNFLYIFSKHNQMSNFMTTRPVGAEFFHADRQRDNQNKGRTVVAFRNFANTSKQKSALFAFFCCKQYNTQAYEKINPHKLTCGTK